MLWKYDGWILYFALLLQILYIFAVLKGKVTDSVNCKQFMCSF